MLINYELLPANDNKIAAFSSVFLAVSIPHCTHVIMNEGNVNIRVALYSSIPTTQLHTYVSTSDNKKYNKRTTAGFFSNMLRNSSNIFTTIIVTLLIVTRMNERVSPSMPLLLAAAAVINELKDKIT